MELIEREVAIEVLENSADYYSHIDDCTEHAIRQCISTIKKVPTIDTAPSAHGRWKKRKDGTPYCSACGANERDFYDAVIEECRFCYRCGARMIQ